MVVQCKAFAVCILKKLSKLCCTVMTFTELQYYTAVPCMCVCITDAASKRA